MIENQLFSKTCRPSSLASDSGFANSSVQIPTPKGSNLKNMVFSQSMCSDNLKSFVNLKNTVSEIETFPNEAKAFLKTGNKGKISDHFTEILPELVNKEKSIEEKKIFETNGEFQEKIGICESKIMTEEQIEDLSNQNEKTKSEDVVEAYTSDVFQIILNEILEEIAKSN